MKTTLLTIIVAFFTTVCFSQTTVKTDIKPINLPRCMPEWAKKNLVGYNPEKAMKIEETKSGNKMTFYFVLFLKKAEKQWVKFSADCTSATKVTQSVVDPYIALEPPVPNKKKADPTPPGKN